MKMPFRSARPLWRVSFVFVLAFAFMTGLCAWTSSCGTAQHKAAVAADSIANSLKTAADLNHSLAATGQITVAERQQVATLIDQASQANDVLVAQLTTAEANQGPVNTASILAAFSKFTDSLNTLEANGVLHLKSTTAQASFETIITAIRVETTILQAQIGSSTSRNQNPPRSPLNGGILSFAALALTPEEIAALITLATEAFGEGASLVQKLIGMKGKADTALLADAATEDAAARKEAQADEAAE
jgi:hypothetical protein